MGLGPPVCTTCKVYASITEIVEDQQLKLVIPWHCPINPAHELYNLWELPLAEQSLYKHITE